MKDRVNGFFKNEVYPPLAITRARGVAGTVQAIYNHSAVMLWRVGLATGGRCEAELEEVAVGQMQPLKQRGPRLEWSSTGDSR